MLALVVHLAVDLMARRAFLAKESLVSHQDPSGYTADGATDGVTDSGSSERCSIPAGFCRKPVAAVGPSRSDARSKIISNPPRKSSTLASRLKKE